MPSELFSTDKFETVQSKIKVFLNAQDDFLSARTISSPRAVGDAIQGLLADNLESLLEGFGVDYNISFARRAMADLAFYDSLRNYYVVDVKTHRLDTAFNMPNLTSVERLTRFYEDDKNYFVLLQLGYDVVDLHIEVSHVHFVPIEFLDWSCLTIGALGWGQLQIANARHITVSPHESRRGWMIQLCDRMLDFYPAEIEKIHERIQYFEEAKRRWEGRS